MELVAQPVLTCELEWTLGGVYGAPRFQTVPGEPLAC